MKLRRLAMAAAAGLAALLTGCDGFFVPLTSTTGGGSGGGSSRDFVYAANSATNTVTGYGIGTGVFVAVPGSPLALSFTPTSLAITPDNQFLYVGGNGIIYVFAIGSDGKLTAGNGGTAVGAVSAASMVVSPDGKYLYALDGFVNTATNVGAVDIFTIGTSGVLSSQPVVQPFTVSGPAIVPRMLALTPAGNLLYGAVGTAGVISFTVNTSTGELSNGLVATPTTASSDNGLTIDASSTFVYVAQSGVTTGVMSFTIGSNGALTSVSGSPFAAGKSPVSVTLDGNGKYLYAANNLDLNTVNLTGYTVGTGGTLTALASSPFQSGGSVIALAHDNTKKYIVVASQAGGPDLELYSLSSTSPGSLISAATVNLNPTSAPVAIALTH